MMDFRFCNPDANNFNKVFKIKSVDNWNVEYVRLDKDIGYFITELPFEKDLLQTFSDLISCFPIQKDNNHPDNMDPNPFDTIHVPEWVTKDICLLLKDFYIKHITKEIVDPQIHEWGNVYVKSRSKPISCWRIPHIDYTFGIVANMWFTDHDVEDSSTKLYRYLGKMYDEIYDFQIEESHKLHNDWKHLSLNATRSSSWFNFDDKELERWGFEYVGAAPTKINTMTMYKSNIHHLAYISDKVDFRWSHAFAFSHLQQPQIFLKNIY